MTYANYAPRVKVHPDRYGAVKTNGPNLWAILHTSEGGESSSAAEGLASFMTQPGDRTTDSGSRYGSSYQVVFDTDRVIPAVPYDVVSYSASGANAQGVHGCFPGRAGQSRAQWLDSVTRPMIRQAAAWLLDVEVSLLIPPVRITAMQMMNAQRGYADHATVTAAFRRTDHTDVGPNFPWDVLAQDVRDIRNNSQPEGEDIMKALYYPGDVIKARTSVHIAAFESGILRHASGPDTQAWAGVPTFPIQGVEHFNQLARMANHMSGAEIPLL